jgi:quinoprotein glucose dehydrogenase
MGRLGRIVVLVSSLFAAALLAQSPSTNGPRGATPHTTWTALYAAASDRRSTRRSTSQHQTTSHQLDECLRLPRRRPVIFNPLVVDGVKYLQASAYTLAAGRRPPTGKEIWRKTDAGTIGARGMNYWESPDRSDRRLLFIAGGYSRQSTRRAAMRCPASATTGRVDLRIALDGRRRSAAHGQPWRIFENTMIVSLPAQGAGYDATPADVQAYDVRTGRIQWVFHSIPHPGEFGYDTWPPEAYKNSGGVHNWSESTIDERRGIAFISFGSPRFDFYGGDRPGNNLFGNSLVALDARTGKRIWHYQLVHHDLWDYDLPQAPKLLTIRQNGRTIDVVAQATKHGFLFVFERETDARSGRSRTAGAAVRRAGRAFVADAAVPDQGRHRSLARRSPRRTSTRICRRRTEAASCSA